MKHLRIEIYEDILGLWKFEIFGHRTERGLTTTEGYSSKWYAEQAAKTAISKIRKARITCTPAKRKYKKRK